MTFTNAQEELIKNATFHPVFGPDGQFEGIQQLEIATDRRLGIRAIEEMMDSYASGDEQVLANGFTRRQLRILNSPAPDSAHYLNPTKKYDAATGEMKAGLSVMIPFEVAWRLFELLFEGQYSIDIGDHETKDEEEVQAISEGSSGDASKKPDNAPGRIFYSRAHVTITLHLSGGEEKRYTGVGVGYDYVRQDKLGNVFAINSARRTVEKGAVSDAKREALSNIGRVFRRAFEDGDEMLRKMETILLEVLQEANKVERPTRATDAPKVAAPKPRKAGVVKKTDEKAQAEDTTSEEVEKPKKSGKKTKKSNKGKSKSAPEQPSKDEPVDEVPYDSFTTEEPPKAMDAFSVVRSGKVEDQTDDPDLYFDRIGDALAECDSMQDAKGILGENADDLTRAEKSSKAGNTVSALKEMAFESLEGDEEDDGASEVAAKEESAEAPDSEQSTDGWKIEVEKTTGAAILDGYKKLFAKAKSSHEVDQILEANTELAKRLTNSQKGTLLTETSKAKKKSA